MRISRVLVATALFAALAASAREASAQGKPARPKAAVKGVKASAAKPKRAPKSPGKPVKPSEPESSSESSEVTTAPSAEPPAQSEAEQKPKAAGTNATQAGAPKGPVKEKEGPEGVKTYQFGAIEVEGRQKSPELIYFLRRVRAEFDAGALGRRSFLGELADSRNDPAFR